MPTRQLIITADDFGLSRGINEGIRKTIDLGPVRSVSTLVNFPAFKDAVAVAQGVGPAVGIGIHVNLVVGRPLTRAPSLVHPVTGEFRPLRVQFRRALLGLLSEDEIRVETAAQIARLADAGVCITHLDSHRHLHLVPGIRAAVVDAAQAAGIRRIRHPKEPLFYDSTNWSGVVRKTLLRMLCAVSRPATCQLDHVRFFGPSLQEQRDFERKLHRLLDRLPIGTTELMVHPGHAHDVPRAYDDYIWPREVELVALTSPTFLDALASSEVTLTHFGELDDIVPLCGADATADRGRDPLGGRDLRPLSWAS